MKKLCKIFTASLLASSLVVIPVFAEPTVNDMQNSKSAAQGEVGSLQKELTALLNKITALETGLEEKQQKVIETNEDLEEASYQERKQYADMKLRIQYMYEEGDASAIEALLSSKDFSDLINKAEYVQNVHSYDKQKLGEYIQTKEKVEDLKQNLDSEVATMQSQAQELQTGRESLNATISTKQEQIAQLDQSIQSALAAAAAEAARQEAAQQPAAAGEVGTAGNTDGGTGTTDAGTDEGTAGGGNDNSNTGNSDQVITPPSGTSGSAVADYACQFVGNPYVYGGDSLTNGTDCSGFTMSVYAAFGVSLPHYDGGQESCGREVSYDEAQPGDLICYGGHVGIYIGGGSIVHASNSAPYPEGGIKISSATYRSIRCVRRIFG